MNPKAYLFLLAFLSLSLNSFGQVSVPYSNDFDDLNDIDGWSHYAISGSDDWEVGVPNSTSSLFSAAYTTPNAWVTNLDGDYSDDSEQVLETPAFDLSDTSVDMVLSFYQKKRDNNTNAYLEYSIDGGNTWLLLNDSDALKKKWQGNNGFTGDYDASFRHSAINISFIQGNSDVRFRFRYVSTFSVQDGWMIDNFKIGEAFFNIYASQGDSIFISQTCDDFTVETSLGFHNQYSNHILSQTNYYFSTDLVLDEDDPLLSTKTSSFSSSIPNWNHTIDIQTELNAGIYYILFEHDALDAVVEDPSDNVGYAVMKVDTVFHLPIVESFEDTEEIRKWKSYKDQFTNELVWELGEGYLHHLEDARSGTNAWHTSKSLTANTGSCSSDCEDQYVESPFINLTSSPEDLTLSLWFKNVTEVNNIYSIEYSSNCGLYWNELTDIQACRDDDWDFINVSLQDLVAEDNVKFRVRYTTSYLRPDGIIFDDIYIGAAKPDLSIERDKANRYTVSTESTDSVIYFLNNAGLATLPETTTSFYWSDDPILDASDLFLGSKTEAPLNDTARVWSSFGYTKPTTATGIYYIFYKLDDSNIVDEMREYDNEGYFTVHQETPITAPYFNDFETQIDGWRHNASLGEDDWSWSSPAGTILNAAFSGTKALITNNLGAVSPMSRMHMYSPVFDLSNLTNPVLEFDLKLDSNGSCHCFEGKMNMSYSVDGGTTWEILDTTSQSYNRWYYHMDRSRGTGIDYVYNVPNYSETLMSLHEGTFANYTQYNSRDVNRNTKYILDLSQFSGENKIQFRYNLATQMNDSELVTGPVEGALIDNFRIRDAFTDLNINYKKDLMVSSNVEELKFFMNIKNQGNYFTAPSVAKFYVSSDTILSADDFVLGFSAIPVIRPDFSYYLNTSFDTPDALENYQFLLYELDVFNANNESIESNNIGYWNLVLDNVESFPYFNDFNDTIVNGWHTYSTNEFDGSASQFRLRNVTAPAEIHPVNLPTAAIESGMWFTESMYHYTTPPNQYLISPAFNFENIDSISISFDLLCTGQQSNNEEDGGNFQYSIDGGNTWAIMDDQDIESHNWYSYWETLPNLDGELGWNNEPSQSGSAILDSTSIDASYFCNGQKEAVFRFKYRGSWLQWLGSSTQGLRVDNFLVKGFTTDYIALDSLNPVQISSLDNNITLEYAISNFGQTSGRATNLNFYWSEDNVFDSSDTLIHTVMEDPIGMNNTLNNETTFNYPTPLNQSSYFVFYTLDADNNIIEIDEANNIGSYQIDFIPYANYQAASTLDTIFLPTDNLSFALDYSIINNGIADGLPSTTAFYWSTDNILDSGDLLLETNDEEIIPIGGNTSLSINLDYTGPLDQENYFLLISVDHEDEIVEIDESSTDNIKVVQISIFTPMPNYQAVVLQDSIAAQYDNPNFEIDYAIINNGTADGGNSTTGFYWSEDNIFDSNDIQILNAEETTILAGDTLALSATIEYMGEITQENYFLFVNLDINNEIDEIDESDIDNVKVIKVIFDLPDAIINLNETDASMYYQDGILNINLESGLSNNAFTLRVVNMNGQILHFENVNLFPGLNRFPIPNHLPSGMYLLNLYNKESNNSIKAIIQN